MLKRKYAAPALLFAASFLAAGAAAARAAEAPSVSFDFAKDTADGWGKTKGATFAVQGGTAVVDGTDWDSKIYRTVNLAPGTRHRMSGVGSGKLVARLHVGWGKAFAELDLSGDAPAAKSVEFATPDDAGKYTLSVQVNAAKGRAALKSLAIEPMSAENADRAAIDFATEDPGAWSKTKSTEFAIVDGAAVLDGTTWDSKIYRGFRLTPGQRYRVEGVGRGQVMVRGHVGLGKPFFQLNLSGKDFRADQVEFIAPDGNGAYNLSIQVNAAKGRGEVKTLAFAPLADEAALPVDRAALARSRPTPPVVRGFMVGRFDDAAADTLRDWGANVIRLQLAPIQFAKRRNQDWEAAWPALLDDTEEKVLRAGKRGIKVVVDLHQPPVPGVRGDYTEMWTHPETERNFLRVWRDLAVRLKPHGEHIWGYDLLNEPLDRNQLPNAPRLWRPLAEKLIAAIREIDPEVWIVYEPGPGGGSHGLKGMKPFADAKVIYSTHFYTPGAFTHQGITDIAGTDLAQAMEKINVAYPGEVGGKRYDKAALAESLKTVDDFLKEYPVPHYVGEFSVVRWAPEGSGEQWLRDVIELFEERGWSWSYHAFREFNGWSLEHGPEYWRAGAGLPEPKFVGDTARGAVVKEYLRRNAR